MSTIVSLIKKIFIKNYQNTEDVEVRTRYGLVAGIVGIICNLLLFSFKLTVGFLINSIAVQADAINNLSDMGSSLVTMFAFKFSSKPADEEHPYGHGRLEYIAGLIISIVICVIGIELFKGSVEKIISGEASRASLATIIILTASVLVKLWMAFFNKNFSKAINSLTLKATSVDSLNDAITTTAILASILVVYIWGINIDGYVGALASIYIIVAGVKMAKDTADVILGEKTDPELVENIESIVEGYDEILGVHDLVIHDYGPGRKFASLHAEVSMYEDIMKSHDIIDNCEKELFSKLGIMVSIHLDPIETDNEELEALKNETKSIVKEIDERLSIHDFRAVWGTTHTNLIFDLVVPYDLTKKSGEIVKNISDEMLSRHENYYCVIQVDNLYT